MEESAQRLEGEGTTNGPISYSFEEFRMMYQSTERVSDRKIAFTRDNSQLCMAMIAAQGLVASWAYQKPDVQVIVGLALIFISILGVVFCRYWVRQLLAFKELNFAKFKVLEEMAEHVVFPDYRELRVRSMNPFMHEYKILADRKKLTKVRGRDTQKASMSDEIVPASFIAFFCLTALLCLYLVPSQTNLGSFRLSWP